MSDQLAMKWSQVYFQTIYLFNIGILWNMNEMVKDNAAISTVKKGTERITLNDSEFMKGFIVSRISAWMRKAPKLRFERTRIVGENLLHILVKYFCVVNMISIASNNTLIEKLLKNKVSWFPVSLETMIFIVAVRKNPMPPKIYIILEYLMSLWWFLYR